MTLTHLGRYEIIETIGQGAMGAVYKARDPLMDRVVAVKTILDAALSGPMAKEFRDRFFREARAAGRFSHPGIVTVYDVGEHEGTPFLVMEYVKGRTLESALESGERFPLDRIYELGQEIAEALDYAHQQGVIHRDIKPANILLTGAPERAKIADFGVAKLSSAQVTATGRLLGTPSFMAPEQFTGAPIDGRVDLFSFGVILYWMATGDKPFTGETITAVSYKIVHTDPVAPRRLNPAIPRDLEAALLRCLAKDPAARYQTGGQLAQDLEALRARRSGTLVSGSVPVVEPVIAGAEDPEKTRRLPRQSVVPPARPPASVEGKQAAPRASVPDGTFARPPAHIGAPARAIPVPTSAAQAVPVATVRPAAPIQLRYAEPPRKRRASVVVTSLALLLAVLAAGTVWKRHNAKASKEAAAGTPAVAVASPTPTTSAVAPVPATPMANPTPTRDSAAAGNAAPAPKPVPATAVMKTSSEKPEASSPPAARTNPARPAAAAQPHALLLEVHAMAPMALEIQSDDEPIVTRQMNSGGSFRAAAERVLWLRTDNAGALQLKLNGYDLPKLGPLGMPRTLRLTPRVLDSLRAGPSADLPQGQSSPAVQAGHAHLYIEVKHIPNSLNLLIWMDGKMFFSRPASPEPGGGPVESEKDLPPGNHHFVVFAGLQRMREGLEQQVSGNFQPGLARTLRIGFRRDSASGAQRIPQLTADLE